MKKKYIFIAITFFILMTGKANAYVGELRYDVTNLKISPDGTINFKGWAFLHQTHNFVTVNKMNSNGNETSEILNITFSDGTKSTSGGQKIYIRAYYQNNNRKIIIDEREIDGQKSINGKTYNFYQQMYFNFNSKDEAKTLYNETTHNFSGYIWDNKCDPTAEVKYGRGSNCYYEDLGFDISFNVRQGNWLNVPEESNIYFEIAATNTDYQKKTGNKTSSYEPLYVRKGVFEGNGENDYIQINKTSFSSQVKFIAITAWVSEADLKKENGKEVKECIGATNKTYEIVQNSNSTGFTNGYLGTEKNSFPNNTNGPGRFLINTAGIKDYEDNRGICPPGNNVVKAAWASWVKPTGDLKLNIKVKNDKKCAVSEPASNKTMNCNEWKDLSSKCDALTVRNNGTSEVVKIEQKGYITNIFKSNLVNEDKNYDANSYNGGWLKYGITYYNEVSWSYNTIKSRSTEAQENINEAMQNKLKKLDKFEENINLTINGLDGSRLVKKCTQSGSFTPANKLITVCTFFLPESYLKELTGNVSYSESNDNANINNKYYIPLDAQKYNISVKLENLSVLSENQAKTDSQKKNSPWFGIWTINTNCSLKVTNRIYEPSSGGKENGKVKYKFIYRPINLSNPFPNRFPGVNWYTWYITEGNKDKKTLEDSYTKLEYYTELDNRAISKIKEYNKINNYFNKVETDFFKDYIKEGGNS